MRVEIIEQNEFNASLRITFADGSVFCDTEELRELMAELIKNDLLQVQEYPTDADSLLPYPTGVICEGHRVVLGVGLPKEVFSMLGLDDEEDLDDEENDLDD